MGKQINYWMGYEDFLPIAQKALDLGCMIVKPAGGGKLLYGRTLELVAKEECRYYFYVPEAGKLAGIESPPASKRDWTDYSGVGNAMIEAGFSFRTDKKKKLTRGRLFVISGYYDDDEQYIPRLDCVTKIYHALVRVAKKAAPSTEWTETYISTRPEDYLQEKVHTCKRYISPRCLDLRLSQNDSLGW